MRLIRIVSQDLLCYRVSHLPCCIVSEICAALEHALSVSKLELARPRGRAAESSSPALRRLVELGIREAGVRRLHARLPSEQSLLALRD